MPATQHTRTELQQLGLALIPDHPQDVVTPAAVRQMFEQSNQSSVNKADDGIADPGATAGSFAALSGTARSNANLNAELNALAKLGPNLRADGFKSVRFLSNTDPRFDPVSDHALDQLDTQLACLGTRCYVDFEQVAYVLRYDGQARPGGQASGPQCWRDGHMAYPTPLVPCVWVAENSPSAQVQDYTQYTPAYNASGPTGYSFPAGTYVGAYVPGMSTEQFFKRRAPGGLAPAPTAGGDATYWELVSGTDVPMPAAPVLFRVLSYADALGYDSDDALRRGQEYLITDRPGGGPDVRGTFSQFMPAAMQYATLEGEADSVRYDLTSDTTTNTVYNDTAIRAHLSANDDRLDTLESDIVAVENEVLDHENRLEAIEDGDFEFPVVNIGGMLLQGSSSGLVVSDAPTGHEYFSADGNVFYVPSLVLRGTSPVTLSAGAGGKLLVGGAIVTNNDIEITDSTKGVIMTVGSTRVRARIAGTAGSRTWTFDEL